MIRRQNGFAGRREVAPDFVASLPGVQKVNIVILLVLIELCLINVLKLQGFLCLDRGGGGGVDEGREGQAGRLVQRWQKA